MRRPWVIGIAAVAVLVLVVVGVVVVRHVEATRAATAAPVPVQGADLSGEGPGSLVSAMSMPGFAATSAGSMMRAARVTYRSTEGDTGAPTVVTGTVFVPHGTAPAGGWPVISFGHGTTGIDEPCAPSLSDTLLGQAETIAGYTHAGYAVAMADYQGLGAPGVHPYTDARTAGLNMIDAVRALRRAFPDVSGRWAAVGGSQGGGAAWAADEQAASYASDLELVGAVAYVPAADVSGILDKAVAGTMGSDQQLAFVAIVESLARLHPDLNRDDYRRGSAAANWDVLAACSGPRIGERGTLAAQLTPADTMPANAQAAARLRQFLQQWALPQKPLSAPLSVVYAGRDEFIDAAFTTAAIARACALGGNVTWDLQPDRTHGTVDVASRIAWLADRFAGTPAVDECPSLA